MTHRAGGSRPPWDEPEYPPQHYRQLQSPDQQWQPQRYEPYAHQRRVDGPREDPRLQAPYPSEGYPRQAPYPSQEYSQPTPWDTGQTQHDYSPYPPQGPERRRRSRWPLYAGTAALVAVAGGGTAYALAGNGGATPTATPGFSTSCSITGRQENAVEFKASITPAQAAEVTDVDVEFLKDGAPLSTQGFSESDGGIGILLSHSYLSAGNFPAYISAGKTQTFVTDPNEGSVFVGPQFENGFPAMPTSCQVIVVATPSDPGNF